MKNDRLGANVLSMKVILNVGPALAKELSLRPERRSLGVITSDCGDVTYVALDEAARVADVTVVYGKSMYAGAANTSTELAGEVIGIIAGPNPAEVNNGLSVITQVTEEEVNFYNANENDNIVYFAHVVSGTDDFSSEQANIPEGETIAYLITPPLGAMIDLDATMKTAGIQMDVFYDPPSETDFDGALLAGNQFACRATCSVFEQVIQNIADDPLSY